MKKRDVILARIYFSDSTESKIRPAIILSNDDYHSGGYLLVAAITTAADYYCLSINENDVNCALEKGSGARFDCIIRIHERQVMKCIGKITPQFHGKLVERIIAMVK